jgi:hypothetical protein
MNADTTKQQGDRPAWITDALIDRTKRVWQARAGNAISEAEAIEFILSATQLWDTVSAIQKTNCPRGPARRME